jgi:hypothetical protein
LAEGELLIEADKDDLDLEAVLVHVQEHVARNGVVVYLDPLSKSGDEGNKGDDEDDDPESACIEWNPFQEFKHSVS